VTSLYLSYHQLYILVYCYHCTGLDPITRIVHLALEPIENKQHVASRRDLATGNRMSSVQAHELTHQFYGDTEATKYTAK
jgi:hypothetical protein